MILPISRTLIGKNKPSAMKMCSLLFLLLLSASAYSQDLRKAEEELLTKFQRISYWRDYRGDALLIPLTAIIQIHPQISASSTINDAHEST